MIQVLTPTILYHYTSPAGLYGILESSSLWASNIHYLNDSKEFKQAIECAKTLFHTGIRESQSENKDDIIKRFNGQLESISQISIHVASLSENGDSLSQWRGYCPTGGGYAAGFNHGRLSIMAEKQGFKLLPCAYTHSEHNSLLKPLIEPLFSVALENLDQELNYFVNKFVQIAPMIKHNSFSEEREWRLISGVFATNRPDWKVRIGRTMLIPYTEFNFGKENESALCEVVVGPTPHHYLSGSSVSSALHKAKIKNWTVRYSQSPFRDW